jgi:hypothetical protein
MRIRFSGPTKSLITVAALAMLAGPAGRVRAETQINKACAEALAIEFAMVDAAVSCDQSWLILPRFNQIHAALQACDVLSDEEQLLLAVGGTGIFKNLEDSVGHKAACSEGYRILWLGEKQ